MLFEVNDLHLILAKVVRLDNNETPTHAGVAYLPIAPYAESEETAEPQPAVEEPVELPGAK